MVAGRTLACSPGPLRDISYARVSFREETERKPTQLSVMADTRRFTGTGRLKTILDAMACWRIKLLHERREREVY